VRAVVIGATGLVGRNVLRALRGRGDEVVAVSRRPPDDSGLCDVRWDPAEGPAPVELTRGADAVVNLAGAPVVGRRGRWDQIRDSRVLLTERLVEGLDPADRGQVLVNASAVGFYGSSEEPVDESDPPGEGVLPELCVAWEAAAERARERGRRVVLVRSGIVLSAQGGALPPLMRATRHFAGGPLGGGRQWWSWIHIEDEVEMILRAIDDREIAGPMNAVSRDPVRQREMAKLLGRLLGRPAIAPAPGFALRLVLGRAAENLLDGQPVLPSVADAIGFEFRYLDLEEALRAELRRAE
jgi:uncharacterized protein